MLGWQVSMTEYKRKIYSVLALMHDLAISSRHANHKKITSYLSDVRPLLDSLTSAFRENTEQSFLLARFRTYIEQEEARLRKRLETAKYDLDALDTLVLINGRVGLERVSPTRQGSLHRALEIHNMSRTYFHWCISCSCTTTR